MESMPKLGDQIVVEDGGSHNYTIGSFYEVFELDTGDFRAKDLVGWKGNWLLPQEVSLSQEGARPDWPQVGDMVKVVKEGDGHTYTNGREYEVVLVEETSSTSSYGPWRIKCKDPKSNWQGNLMWQRHVKILTNHKEGGRQEMSSTITYGLYEVIVSNTKEKDNPEIEVVYVTAKDVESARIKGLMKVTLSKTADTDYITALVNKKGDVPVFDPAILRTEG